ncbi:MAG TPA: hypothetical protein VF156_14435, partial [Agromyces sp.]
MVTPDDAPGTGPRDELVSPALARELARPAAARRRGRLLRAGAATALVAACVAAGVAVALSPDHGPDAAPPPAVPSPTVVEDAGQSGWPGRPPGYVGRDPLDGEWRTPALTRADVAARLRADGLAAYAADYVRTLPAGTFRIRLSVFAGRVAASVDHTLLDGEFLLAREGDVLELRRMSPDLRRSTWTV